MASEGRLHHRASVVVEPDADEHLVEPGRLLDLDPPAVVEGPLPLGGGVPLVADRVEDHAALGLAVVVIGDGDGEVGDLVGEVVGAVDRVDDPEVLGGRVALSTPPRRGSRARGRPS